jgi:hypothetical protein
MMGWTHGSARINDRRDRMKQCTGTFDRIALALGSLGPLGFYA